MDKMMKMIHRESERHCFVVGSAPSIVAHSSQMVCVGQFFSILIEHDCLLKEILHSRKSFWKRFQTLEIELAQIKCNTHMISHSLVQFWEFRISLTKVSENSAIGTHFLPNGNCLVCGRMLSSHCLVVQFVIVGRLMNQNGGILTVIYETRTRSCVSAEYKFPSHFVLHDHSVCQATVIHFDVVEFCETQLFEDLLQTRRYL
mmetsp:Transcript_7203/g.26973  ORF Transcript_7203/g.26973 Transcript_7203/m.26973 type:complete len:202 (+) Transcript_7203:3427-4032(+)